MFDEVERLYIAASKQGREWKLLVTIGIYTGLRLGDCCRLEWESVNLERRVIQLIPSKTKKHMHGRPVTIPIHPRPSEWKDVAAKALSPHSTASGTRSSRSLPTRECRSRSCSPSSGIARPR